VLEITPHVASVNWPRPLARHYVPSSRTELAVRLQLGGAGRALRSHVLDEGAGKCVVLRAGCAPPQGEKGEQCAVPRYDAPQRKRGGWNAHECTLDGAMDDDELRRYRSVPRMTLNDPASHRGHAHMPR
jgi:hypothetical protein